MNMFKSCLIIFSIFVSLPVLAGSSTGQITKIYVHKPNPTYTSSSEGVVMFAAGSIANPACSITNEWALSLSTETGRAMYALLLSAAAQKQSITVNGDGACNAWKDRESPYYIVVNY